MSVVGLGYVGLPVLSAATRAGFPVVGFDTDEARIAVLNAGSSYVSDVSDEDVRGLTSVRFTSDASELGAAEVVLIAVPTPLTDGVPDLTWVTQAARSISLRLQPGSLVILESTTYPGTTEEEVLPILETSGMVAGRDFHLAYSPERIDPGGSWKFEDTPKIVSGVGEEATDLCELFYQQLVKETVRVPSPRDAEMAKLIENTFRQVNIALVNELATAAPDLGVDIWSALWAAATKPFGYMPFWPGPGVGGHCIAIDPSYLSFRVKQFNGSGIGLVEHAKRVNGSMPAYVASRISDALNDVGKTVCGSRILAVGLTYKPGVNDVRESPALFILDRLQQAGAVCCYHDPYVPMVQLDGKQLQSTPLSHDVLSRQDCVAILTPHQSVDFDFVLRSARLVFDARGLTHGIVAPNVVRL